jgi:hypothetical protein
MLSSLSMETISFFMAALTRIVTLSAMGHGKMFSVILTLFAVSLTALQNWKLNPRGF